LEYTQVHLGFAWSVFIFLLAAIAAVAFSFWSYRQTVPAVSVFLRRTLASLRSASLVILLFVLFEPVLSLTSVRREPPVIALLIDDSESVGITDAAGDRRAAVETILSSDSLRRLAATSELRWFRFSDESFPMTDALDTLRFEGPATDLASALETVKKRLAGTNFAAAVVVSDGQYNVGSNPVHLAPTLGVPIHTIGVGNPTESKDVFIHQVLTNETAYMETAVPVDVGISSFGYRGKRLIVQLLWKDRAVETRYVDAPEDGVPAAVSFDFKAEEIGRQKFTVAVSPLPGELTDRNNRRTFFIKILKNRMRVDLVSGAAGSDHSLLYQVLAEDPNVTVHALIEKADGELLSVETDERRPRTEETDVYLFNQYPTARSGASILAKYVETIKIQHKPVWYWYGPTADVTKLESLKEILAASFQADRSLEETVVHPLLSAAGKNSVMTRAASDPDESARLWAELPPVWIGGAMVAPLKGSEVLVRADLTQAPHALRLRGDVPLVLSRKTAHTKSVVTAGYGWWKAHFVMKGLGRSNDTYRQWVSNTVRWLGTSEDSKPVVITTSKSTYRSAEKIFFAGQVYDEDFRPVSDAVVRVRIAGKTGSPVDLRLEPAGSGRYEGQLQGLDVGDYTFEGEALRGDYKLGSDRGLLTVEPFSIELVNTSLNERLLQQLASASGGLYRPAERWTELLPSLRYEARLIEQSEEMEIWNKMYWLFILAGLLSVEWFIRKRKDML
jgi:hypothetical protein